MQESVEARKKAGIWVRFFPPVSAVIAVIAPALAVATFLGLQVEKKKQLELAYIAKLSLVTLDPGYSGKVRVSYDGRDIQRLTKLSARLMNTGELPIEQKDVEETPTIGFDAGSAKILEAKLIERNPTDIRARCSTTERNEVKIEHGLLNPGDWVSFEVVLDGDLGESWPELRARVAGLPKPTTRAPTSPTRSANLLVSVPGLWPYLVLVLGSIVPLALVGGLGGAILSMISTTWPTRKSRERGLARVRVSLRPDNLVRECLDLLEPTLNDFFERRAIVPGARWLDEPKVIEEALQGVPGQTPPGVTPGGPAEMGQQLFLALRQRLPVAVKHAAYMAHWLGKYDSAENLVTRLRFEPESRQSSADFVARALKAVEQMIAKPTFLLRLRAIREELIASVVLVILGPAQTLVLVGAWQTVLYGLR